jgi:hypothetical protein
VRKEICQASRMIPAPAPAPTTTTNTLVHQQNPTSYLCECDRNNDQKVESEGREVQMGGRDGAVARHGNNSHGRGVWFVQLILL